MVKKWNERRDNGVSGIVGDGKGWRWNGSRLTSRAALVRDN